MSEPAIAAPETVGQPALAPALTIEPQAPEVELPVSGGAAPVEPAAAPAPAVPEAAPLETSVEPVGEPAEPEVPLAEPLPSYEFAWPEGYEAPPSDDPTLSAFVELAGEQRIAPETAQRFVDMHAAEIRRISEQTAQAQSEHQWNEFHKLVTGWEQEFRAADEFKNKTDTTLNDARWAIRHLSGTDDAAKELRDVLLSSGVGNHKAVIRAFANAARMFKEARPGPRPAPQTAQSGNPADRRYGRTMPD